MSGVGHYYPSVSHVTNVTNVSHVTNVGNHLHALSAVPINDALADDDRNVFKDFVELCPVDKIIDPLVPLPKGKRKMKQPGEKRKKKDKKEPKPPKEFKRVGCKCWFHCDKIPEEPLRKVFDQFQKMKSWNEQSVFISSLICEVRF